MGLARLTARLLRFAPVGVLVVCAAAALGLTVIVVDHQRSIARTFRYDVTWDASQALAESLRLQVAVALLALPDGGGDPDRARLLFEVLVSGLRTLQRGDNRGLVAQRPELGEIVVGLATAVEAVRQLLPALEQPGVPQQILGLLQPQNPRLGALAALANSAEAEAVARSQRQLSGDQWQLTGLLAALVVYGMLLMALLSRRNRLVTRAHLEVRELADSLQVAGGELSAANAAVQAANAELSLRNAHFQAALENMSQALCMVDGQRRLIVCNQRFSDMFALPPASAVPGTLLDGLFMSDVAGQAVSVVRGARRALWAEHLLLAQQCKPSSFLHEDDERTLAVSQQPLPDGGWVATYEDVTERRRVEARIEHMAMHDALTGLPNRALYRQRIEEIIGGTRSYTGHLSVLLLDLDHFKEVNDTLGHGTGDALLEAVARRLRACTRESDLVARLGGDEFAVIQAPGVQPTDAAKLAERIVESVGAPYDIDGERVLVSASVGIAVEPVEGASAGLLLKYADMALYQAKANGRATYCFYEPAMDLQVQTRRALSADLRDAIALGQFEVHYQPLMDLREHRIGGFEALIRWRHPVRGMISPAQFIPIAEDTGLITVIGEWVLRQACAEAAEWPAHVRIAVNLSPRQFRSNDVTRWVTRTLRQTGLAPHRLELEITESLLLQDGDEVLTALRELRALGVGVALDDFGTGYSSLSYLRKFPFTKLKIDQSFVRGMQDQQDNIIIVQAVTAMAQRLGMTVTAEGIETEEQLGVVRDAGCSQGQGYLFGRPANAAEARRLLARQQANAANLHVAI